MWLSVGRRARELYDLPPLLGFFRDALSIFGRREGEHRASKVGEARLHLGGACGRSRPWVSEIAPMVRLMPRPDYKRSRVRREPRAIGSATDKLPSKHPAAIPGWGSPSAEERLGHPATAQPFGAVGLVVVLLAKRPEH